jgi:hypothetical protein
MAVKPTDIYISKDIVTHQVVGANAWTGSGDATGMSAIYSGLPLTIKPQSSSAKILLLGNFFGLLGAPATSIITNGGTKIKKGTTEGDRLTVHNMVGTVNSMTSAVAQIPLCSVIDPSNTVQNLEFKVRSTSTYTIGGMTRNGSYSTSEYATGFGSCYLIAFAIDPTASLSSWKQVVTTEVTTSSQTSLTSGSYLDPSLSVTITPTSASSYLMIIVSTNSDAVSPGSITAGTIKLQRDGSDILVGTAAGTRRQVTACNTRAAGNPTQFIFTCMIPATSTAATTIKVLLGNTQTTTQNINFNRTNTDTDTAAYPRMMSEISVIEVLPS